jgi:exonuclease III
LQESPIYLSILTPNINAFNCPIKRHHLANKIIKEDMAVCCLQETQLIDRNKHWLMRKGWKNTDQANGPPNQAGVAILIYTYLRQGRLQTYIDKMR